MKFVHALKLHNGDEVLLKKTEESRYAVSVEIHFETSPKEVLIFCNDGETYHHTEVM